LAPSVLVFRYELKEQKCAIFFELIFFGSILEKLRREVREIVSPVAPHMTFFRRREGVAGVGRARRGVIASTPKSDPAAVLPHASVRTATLRPPRSLGCLVSHLLSATAEKVPDDLDVVVAVAGEAFQHPPAQGLEHGSTRLAELRRQLHEDPPAVPGRIVPTADKPLFLEPINEARHRRGGKAGVRCDISCRDGSYSLKDVQRFEVRDAQAEASGHGVVEHHRCGAVVASGEHQRLEKVVSTDVAVSAQEGLITRGWADPQNYRSLTHGGNYDSELPGEKLVPGKFYDMTFDIEPDDEYIPAGKRIGVMIMSSDPEFTMWPKPGTRLTIDLNASSFTLPIVGGTTALQHAGAIK